MMKLDVVRSQARWIMLSLMLVTTMDVASGNQLLIAAVRDQDTATARELIEQNVDVNSPQADGATALHWAVHRDDLETAKMLIEAGADVNVTNDFGIMPISLACTNGNASMVETLLNAGADCSATLMTGESVLMMAAHAGDLNTVDVLLNYGADVNANEPVRNQTALMWALGENHTGVARRLIEQGADVNAQTSLGTTPLLFAAREGNLDATEMFLDAGVDINWKANDEMTALHMATQRGHGDVAALLLDRGADPNADGPGWTPLHWAVGTWETEMNGANGMTAPKGHEWDALRGVQEGKYELVKKLLEHGADSNARLKKSPRRFGFTVTKPPKDMTPLGLAAFAGEADIMRLLADHGADVSLKSEDGLSPLLIAAGVSRYPLGMQQENAVPLEDLLAAVQVAVELGADVHETSPEGDTAMHGAAWIRSEELIRFLADHGADVNAVNDKGQSPIFIAERDGRTAGTGPKLDHSEIADLLRDLSVPQVIKNSMHEWSKIPRHVRIAVESLLQGEMDKIEEEPDYIERDRKRERERRRKREQESKR